MPLRQIAAFRRYTNSRSRISRAGLVLWLIEKAAPERVGALPNDVELKALRWRAGAIVR